MTRSRLAVVLVAVVLAGCGASEGGEPAGSRPAETFTPTLPGEDYVVPAVTDPLDLRPYVDDPCGLLTGQQASELGLPRAEPRPDRTCLWGDAAAGPLEGIIGGPRVTGGLADFYTQYRGSGDGSWEPVEVDGYPAAYANGELQVRHGQCVLLVGVADDQFLRVEDSKQEAAATDGAERADCARATDVAELIVANVRESS